MRAPGPPLTVPLHSRLADWIVERARTPGFVVGLSGAQGSGKSTLADGLAGELAAQGLSVAVLSLDDVYRTRAERAALAAAVHPLLQTRGPPGTHDVELAERLLDALARAGPVTMPRFDKARDDRAPPEAWDRVEGPADVILFEGWCLGVPPQAEGAVANPVNALERERDPDGRWRRWVNAQLSKRYARLWERLDALVVLQAPSFDVVLGWRLQAERALRARTGLGMSDDEVAAFVAHYERLTRWALETLPARADVLIELAPDRRPRWVRP